MSLYMIDWGIVFDIDQLYNGEVFLMLLELKWKVNE